MLKHLYIKNFVLIDELNLDFSEGFSAFTGETGAGKSILIDAISLLSAQRASASFISKGKDLAIIEGTFDIQNDKHAVKTMQEAGFEVEEETTFTREIHSNGKSSARIDHRVVTLSLLRDVLRDEIDIHGQRDNAYLLNTNTHLHLLDEYASDQKALHDVMDAYKQYDAFCKEKEKALQDTYNENDLEYFRYQVNDIEAADLHIGEDEELEEKEKAYRSVKNSLDKFHQIFELYDNSVSGEIYDLNKLVQSLKGDDKTESLQKEMNDAYYAITDSMEQLHTMADSYDLSEEDINAMEERLFTIQKLKRKYGHSIEDILKTKEELQQKIHVIDNRQGYLQEIDKKIQSALKIYNEKALALSKIREKKAVNLDRDIAANLKDLQLPNARFHTELTPCKPSLYGNEKAEFLISMNKGEDLKPLSKTASGGELSRLMLGLKVIFTHLQGIQTVIFDEIDTGVSGPVATAIGRKMKELSKDCQVFAVTHLAQVAACADHEYLVHKSDDEKETHTTVKELNEEETINQLALISNGEITDAAKKAARELYRRNQKA